MVTTDNDALDNPPRFGGFYDKDGYNWKAPSAAVLRVAWDVAFTSRREYYRRSSQLFDGDNVAFDESHKLVKGIRVENSKVYSGVFTAINQHNQVVAQVSFSASVDEAKSRVVSGIDCMMLHENGGTMHLYSPSTASSCR